MPEATKKRIDQVLPGERMLAFTYKDETSDFEYDAITAVEDVVEAPQFVEVTFSSAPKSPTTWLRHLEVDIYPAEDLVHG